MGPRARLEVLEKRKITCSYQDLDARPSSQKPHQYTMIYIKMLHTSNYTDHLCAWKETALRYASFFHYAVACHKNSHTLTSIHFNVQKYDICSPLFLEPIMLQHIPCKPTVSMWTSCYNYFPKHTWTIALYKIYAKLDHRRGLLLHAMQN